MNLVAISVYGEGYYSGSSYEETIFLLEEDYKSLGVDLREKDICLGELDGKHSCVYGEADVDLIDEERQRKYNFRTENDGDTLYWELMDEVTGELPAMIDRAWKYIKTIDTLITVSFKVRESQVDAVKEAVEKIISCKGGEN